jgi:hypothetical protein
MGSPARIERERWYMSSHLLELVQAYTAAWRDGGGRKRREKDWWSDREGSM